MSIRIVFLEIYVKYFGLLCGIFTIMRELYDVENPLSSTPEYYILVFTCRQVKTSQSANSEAESDVETYFALF